MDFPAGHSAFVDINLRSVESSPIVNGRNHKFNGIVHLQIKALVTFHRIGSGMRFAERIARKTFYLTVNFPGEFFRMPLLFTAFKKMIFHFLKFLQ